MTMKVAVTVVELLEDTPIIDEAYAVITDGTRFAFAWGPKYPYADEVPAEDVLDGESGVEWHDTEEAARKSMRETLEAAADTWGIEIE